MPTLAEMAQAQAAAASQRVGVAYEVRFRVYQGFCMGLLTGMDTQWARQRPG